MYSSARVSGHLFSASKNNFNPRDSRYRCGWTVNKELYTILCHTRVTPAPPPSSIKCIRTLSDTVLYTFTRIETNKAKQHNSYNEKKKRVLLYPFNCKYISLLCIHCIVYDLKSLVVHHRLPSPPPLIHAVILHRHRHQIITRNWS